MLANPTVSDGELKALLWVYGANHNQFNSAWPSETPPATHDAPRRPGTGREGRSRHALRRRCCWIASEYLEVLRDHAARRRRGCPSNVDLVSQYQDPERVFICSTIRKRLAAPQVSLPVQGTVAADAVTARAAEGSRQRGRAGHDDHAAPGVERARGAPALASFDPGTVPAERYKTLALRVGQSTEAKNAANRDQDFTLEVSSGSRTASFRASSSAIGSSIRTWCSAPGKIVMQTLRLPIQRLVDHGVEPRDLRSIALRLRSVRRPASSTSGDVQLSN